MHSDCSDYQAGFRNCLAGVNQYLLMTDIGGSNRSEMLAQLSSRFVRIDAPRDDFSTMDSDLGNGRKAGLGTQRLSAGVAMQASPIVVSSGIRVQTAIKRNNGISTKTTQLPGKVHLPGAPVGVTAMRKHKENCATAYSSRDSTSSDGHHDEYVLISSDSYWRPW